MNGYFDLKAENYLKRSSNFLWASWRKSERHAIENLLKPIDNRTLLDLGSGAGYYSLFFKKKYNLQVLAVDSSLNMVRELQKNGIRSVGVSLEEISFDEKFDYILAAGVFEFIDDPLIGFKKIHNHLKIDGKFVILVPSSGFWGALYKIFHQVQNCPTNIRHRKDYEKIAKLTGFKCLAVLKPTLISQAIYFSRMD